MRFWLWWRAGVGGSCSYNTAKTPSFGVKGNLHFTSSSRNKGRCVGDDGSSEGDCSSLPLCSPTSCCRSRNIPSAKSFPPSDSLGLTLVAMLCHSYHIFRQLIGQPCNRGTLRLHARMRHAECLCACVRACVCVCMCVCVCACACFHTHTCIYTWLHTYMWETGRTIQCPASQIQDPKFLVITS